MAEFPARGGASVSVRVIVVAAAVLALALAGWAALRSDALGLVGDEARLRAFVEGLGWWGPIGVVLLRAGAVMVAFLPNAPISLASGAAYGQLWGTVYVLIGSELGAIIAFLIARRLGFDAVRRWGWIDAARHSKWGGRLFGRNRSQNTLTAAVFLARAAPFVNLDVVSYVAGVTRISFWRYALASLAGLAPYNFLFAFLGDRLVGASARTVTLIILLTAAVTLLPFAAKLLWGRKDPRAAP